MLSKRKKISKEFKCTEHSDILVHWTGCDIDKNDEEMQSCEKVEWRKCPLKPVERPSLINDPEIIGEYLERVRDTLKFGMWMVNDKPLEEILLSSSIKHDGRYKETPHVARTCFTELKLSETRKHAYEYGRLGFGVKRTYLFKRAGLPIIYCNKKPDFTGHPNWVTDPILKSDFAPAYLKHMSEIEGLNYKYYSESEWRIICPNVDNFELHHDRDKNHSEQEVLDKIKGLIVDVKGVLSEEVKKYGNGIKEYDLANFVEKKKESRLRYLLPFDHELSVIVYPCPEVKILAEADHEIRDLILKTRCHHDLNKKRFVKYYEEMDKLKESLDTEDADIKALICKLKEKLDGTGERMMLPMEIDLDTISNF